MHSEYEAHGAPCRLFGLIESPSFLTCYPQELTFGPGAACSCSLRVAAAEHTALGFVHKNENGLGLGSAAASDHSDSFAWLAHRKSLVNLHHSQHSVSRTVGEQSSRLPSDVGLELWAGYNRTFDTALLCDVAAERRSGH